MEAHKDKMMFDEHSTVNSENGQAAYQMFFILLVVMVAGVTVFTLTNGTGISAEVTGQYGTNGMEVGTKALVALALAIIPALIIIVNTPWFMGRGSSEKLTDENA